MAETFIFRGSSNLESATYDPDVENLDITFTDGSEYTYFSVPNAVYRSLTQSMSAGSYFHRNIKSRYSYERK